jgi:hypothetical protein
MRFFSFAASAILAAALLLPIAVSAQGKSANPADFPLTVHVVWSSSQSCSVQVGGSVVCQRLSSSIDGKPVELVSNNAPGVLALGDYKARSIPMPGTPKKHGAYDLFLAYEILLPDGTTRQFGVWALGSAPPALPQP